MANTKSEYKGPAAEYNERKKKQSEYKGPAYEYKASRFEKEREELASRINAWAEDNNRLADSYKQRFEGREAGKYVSDSGEWLQVLEEQGAKSDAEAASIRERLDYYKDFIDADWSKGVLEKLDRGSKFRSDVFDAATADNEYWSQWTTEDDYNKAYAEYEDYQAKLNYDLVAGQAEIDRLQGEIDKLRNDWETNYAPGIENTQRALAELRVEKNKLKGRMDPASKAKMAEIDKKIAACEGAINKALAQDPTARIRELEGSISSKTQYYTLAKRVQDAAKLAGVADPNSEYYDPEFEKYSQLGNTVSWENVGSASKEYGGITVYDDLKAATLVLNEKMLGKEIYSEDMLTPGSGISGYIESLKKSGEYNTENRDLVNVFRKMNEKELSTLAYYLKKDEENGTNLAAEYVGSLKDELNERRGTDIAASKDNLAEQYLFAAEAGWDQFFEGRDALFSGADYIPTSEKQYASGIIREDLAENGPSIFGTSTGQIGYDIINTTSNMLPSILTSASVNAVLPGAGSYVGSALLGASAAGNAKAEMLNLGYSKEQANAYGLMVGASEAVLEKVLGGIPGLKGGDGIFSALGQKALGKIDNALARVAITIGGNMLDEGLEEGIQTILEPWLAEIATKVDWEDPTVDEVLYSSLLGALSSIGFSGAGMVSSSIASNQNAKALFGEYAPELINRALEVGDPKVKALAESYQKKLDAGKTLSGSELNKLAQSVTRSTQKTGADTKSDGAASDPFQSLAIELRAARASRKESYATENPAGKKSAVKTEFEASADGKTIYHSERGDVETSVMEIASIENGKVEVVIDGGEVVDAKDLSFATEDEAMLYGMVANMDVDAQTANALIKGFDASDGVSARDYVIDIPMAYALGKINDRTGLANLKLTDSQSTLAFVLGHDAEMSKARAAAEQLAAAKERVMQSAESKEKRSGRVRFEKGVTAKNLSETQRASLKGIEIIAEALKIDVYIFKSEKVGDRRVGKNGWYDPKDNSIHLDLYAGTDGKGTMLFTMAHELTHFIKEWSPEKFKVFADFLIEQYGEAGISVNELISNQIEKAKRNGREIDFETAYEEVVADSCESFLTDENAIETIAKLKAKDESIWQKIKDFIVKLAARIKAAYKGLTPDSAEANRVLEMVEAVDKLKALWTEALVDASNTGRFVEKDSATDEIKYSDRDYSYEVLTSKKEMEVKTLPKLSEDEIKKYKSDSDLFGKDMRKIAASFNNKKNTPTKTYLYCRDLGADVLITKDSFKHGAARMDATYIAVCKNIADVLNNSIAVNELTERETTNGGYVLLGMVETEDSYVVVRSIVNKKTWKLEEFQELDAIKKKGIKKEDVGFKPPHYLPKKGFGTSSVISIADFLEFVNTQNIANSVLSSDVIDKLGSSRGFDENVTPNLKYSDRDTESFSNRSLLANALESAAKNDIEKKRLSEYKERVAMLDEQERKLHELNAKIKELSFAKGPRDQKLISELRAEATKTANRIKTHDGVLLRLEAAAALKGVLEREKKRAYDRASQKGKEALKAYREKQEKRLDDTKAYYRESRRKAVEGRNKTGMRHKIKDVVLELNRYLTKGTKDKHVPIELQKAVAEALDAVNMDTVGADERIAKLEAELLTAKTLEDMKAITKKIERIQEMGGNMTAKLSRLKTAYDSIIDSDDPLIANSHDDVISSTIEKVMEVVGDTPLRDMSLYQLEAVYDMYKMVLTTVKNANKAFKTAKDEEISVIANRVMEEIDKLGKKKLYSTKVEQIASKFDWNNLKPVYAFERIGSDTFTEVFNNVRAGEDTWAVDITEAKEFSKAQHKKFKYDSWDFKKRFGFTSTSGMHFELSLDQIMSLYAYSKRDQAKDHLKRGGIVFDETTEVSLKTKLGIPVKFNPTQATAYNLSDETLADIIGKLTPEQKEFVDVMQDYLSTTMGDKGNEVSLALYGVKLYKEKNYFPLKSATQFMAKAKEQQKGEVKIKNSGFSKETTPKASNPIVLTQFMDIWADHVNEMSMYHAFVLALEDFYRVFNYKTPTSDTMATESVEMYLQNAYGKAATQYIDQLLKDLNGGVRVDSTVGVINKLTGLFKKSAVFASASVVIQQPSAIARATALVDTKYFVGKPAKGKHKETWAEVKKYAPVAVIKEMGYFDTGMGQSTVEWLKDEKTWKDKVDDVASKAPALADEYAWCAIWNAVKRETLYTHKNLRPNSEEFLKAVGERFTEVIIKTQVYDSVLARSANMRSKDTGMKMATAFMGEPTTSLNMLEDALTQGKRGNKTYARKAIGSVVASMVLNSILVSIVYAGRDDDEDKTYAEKYIGTLTEELLDSINPLTLIPFVKDIVSIAQGYDVERSDMAVISDIIKAWNNLGSDNRSVYRKIEDFAGAIASLFGLPVKNIMRDARAMYNTVNSFINGEETTGAGIKNAVTEAVTGDSKSNGQQLYEAMVSGDTAQIERVRGRFKDQNAINSAIRKALRENDPRIKEAAEARYNGDIAEYMRIAKEIIAEGHFKQDDVVAAINAEINNLKKGEMPAEEEKAEEEKASSIYIVSDACKAFDNGDGALANDIIQEIIDTKIANGSTESDARSTVRSSVTSYYKPLYKQANADGNSEEIERIEDVLYETGLYGTRREVDKAVSKWLKDN